MIFAMVLMIVMVLIGIAGIAVGIYELVEYNDCSGIIGISLGAVLLFLSIGLITAIVDDNTETTEKVVGKGTIVTEIDFSYFNGGKDSSNEIKYFIEVECGDKIVVDESVWKEIKDEYTYIPNEAEMIEENDD
jgi:hypothetical protein